jgi:hypothetical protein
MLTQQRNLRFGEPSGLVSHRTAQESVQVLLALVRIWAAVVAAVVAAAVAVAVPATFPAGCHAVVPLRRAVLCSSKITAQMQSTTLQQ